MGFFGGPDFNGYDTANAYLTISVNTVMLPHLRFGDTKTIQSRQVLRRDLVMCSRTWPKHKQLALTFTNLWRQRADSPPQSANKFWKLMRAFPGWPAKLQLPNGMEYYGVVLDPQGTELDNCKEEVAFTFDVSMEFFPEGIMVTE